MKKITITLLLCFAIFRFAYAQEPILIGVSGTTYPVGVTDAAQQLTQDASGNGNIGIGAGLSAGTLPALLTVVNNFTPAPDIMSLIINLNNGTIATGLSPYSLVVGRPPVCSSCGDLIGDFSVDQNGLTGIGAPAVNFNDVFTAYTGTLLGVTDPNNSGTTPLFTVATNLNNPTGFNLPAMTVDYRGYTSLGAYFTDAFPNPAHVFIANSSSDADPLLEVATNSFGWHAAMLIDASGNVGIGTASPANPLDVVGNASISGGISVGSYAATAAPTGGMIVSGQVGIGSYSPPSGVALDVQGGVVRIGAVSTPSPLSTPGYSLYVQYGVLAESYKCALSSDATNWSDYVFDKDYKLLALSDVESYIAHNHHLPDVPSTDDVHCDGIDLAQMDATLLKKIEELTLYVLELKKDNETMKAEITNLKK